MNFPDMGLLRLTLCLVAGAGAGAAYFYGLWWTVSRLTNYVHPRLALLVSFAGRALLVIAVFYLAAGGSAAGYLVCAVGFLVARVFAIRGARLKAGKEAA
jgi:F1F0 ATPase subunit 2